MSTRQSEKQGFRASVKREWNNIFNLSGSSGPSTPAASSHLNNVSRPTDNHFPGASQSQSLANTPKLPTTNLSPLTGTDSLPLGSQDQTPSILPTTTSRLFRYATSNLPAQKALINALKTLQQDAELFPPLQNAICMLIPCIEAMEISFRHLIKYNKLTSSLTTLSQYLAQHSQELRSVKMSESIERMAMSVEGQVKKISEKQDHRLRRDLTQAKRGEEDILHAYQGIEAVFRQLQNDAELSLSKNMIQRHVHARLEELVPSKLAVYNSRLSNEINRRACKKDTRMQVISELNQWSLNPDTPNIYWMTGAAGTGKTTIAYTFADTLKFNRALAASFFCTRSSGECQDAERIIPTIAYQLAYYSTPFQHALIGALDKGSDITSWKIETQFKQMIVEPLKSVKDAMPEGLVVVIDGLDECNDPKGVGLILDLLSDAGSSLPLKFFVVSRPDPDTQDRIKSQADGTRSVFVLHDIERSLVQIDIELYLQEELDFMTVSPTKLKQLAEHCGHSFIYGEAAVRYIRAQGRFVNHEQRLETILNISPSPNH
ncbi:unnamed protein product, partial [Rhizoctonia solani]